MLCWFAIAKHGVPRVLRCIVPGIVWLAQASPPCLTRTGGMRSCRTLGPSAIPAGSRGVGTRRGPTQQHIAVVQLLQCWAESTALEEPGAGLRLAQLNFVRVKACMQVRIRSLMVRCIMLLHRRRGRRWR